MLDLAGKLSKLSGFEDLGVKLRSVAEEMKMFSHDADYEVSHFLKEFAEIRHGVMRRGLHEPIDMIKSAMHFIHDSLTGGVTAQEFSKVLTKNSKRALSLQTEGHRAIAAGQGGMNAEKQALLEKVRAETKALLRTSESQSISLVTLERLVARAPILESAVVNAANVKAAIVDVGGAHEMDISAVNKENVINTTKAESVAKEAEKKSGIDTKGRARTDKLATRREDDLDDDLDNVVDPGIKQNQRFQP